MGAMENRLLREIGQAISHAVNVVVEQIGSKIGVLQEKLGADIASLRKDLDEHRNDSSIHLRPSPTPPKRAATRKTRRGR
jgi:hypothetical protein